MLNALLDRSVVFSYDRTGFWRHRRRFDPRALEVDLTGRHVVLTGGSSGLGAATARSLTNLGARVSMPCRDVEKGLSVRQGFEHPTRARVTRLDLSDLDQVREAADELEGTVDVLIHNAGVLPSRRRRTAAGLDETLATNLVGPLLLTHLLWPRLARGARIVHVSSGGMYTQRLDVQRLIEPPEPFDGVVAYARTKRAQVVLAELLAARSDKRVSSMHPGWAATPGVASSLPRFHSLTRPILRTAAEGADTIVWLAASGAADDPRGRFYFDRAPQSTYLLPRTVEAPAEREHLWRVLCELVGADPERDFR